LRDVAGWLHIYEEFLERGPEVFGTWLDPPTPGSPGLGVDKPIFNPIVDGCFYRMHVQIGRSSCLIMGTS
jgi:hypothetical protein